MFEEASRLKLRFDSSVGKLTVEDLWQLPLSSTRAVVNLDDIARKLHKQLRNDDDVSFVDKDRKSDSTVQLRFDIIKHIIDVRLAEDVAESQKQENARRKQKLLSIIADREDDALRSMPLDELRKAIEEL